MKISYKIAIPLILLPFLLIGSFSALIIFSLSESGAATDNGSKTGEISSPEQEQEQDDGEQDEDNASLHRDPSTDQTVENTEEDTDEEMAEDTEEDMKDDTDKAIKENEEETAKDISEKEVFIDDLLKGVNTLSTNPEDYNFSDMDDVSQRFNIPNLLFYVRDNTLFIGSETERGSLPTRDNYVELFDALNITDIVILDGIENLPGGFLRGGNVKNLYIGDTLTDIAPFAAINGSLEHIQFGEAVSSIGRYAFANNQLQGHLSIPVKVDVIEKRSFSFNHLDYVELSNVEKIEDDAFSSNNLIYVDIPDTTETIGKNAFLPKSFNNGEAVYITSVTFGEQLRIIEKYAFLNQRIQHLEFPESLEFLGDGAFRNAPVNTLIIPSKEVIIGHRVFTSNIKDLKISGRILATGFNTIQDQENYILVND